LNAYEQKRVHPLEYQKRFLEQNVRSDGRTVNKFRPTAITFDSVSTCVGSSFVKIGDTSVVAGVRAELGADSATDCTVLANIELLPICSSKFTFGRPPAIAQCLNAWMNQILQSGNGVSTRRKLVDQSTLSLASLQPPRKLLPVDNDDERSNDEPQYADTDEQPLMSWYLYVDLYCLDHCGNLYDASLLALVSALVHVRLPVITRTEKGEYVRAAALTTPLKLNFVPISASFIVVDNQYIIADPSLEEEEFASASLTVVVDEKSNIINVRKPGGASMSMDAFNECVRVTRQRRDAVHAMLTPTAR